MADLAEAEWTRGRTGMFQCPACLWWTSDKEAHVKSCAVAGTRKTHHVKSWTHFYQAIVAGLKTHDLRKNDRDYNVGDHLMLHEYDNVSGRYTGEKKLVEITYITDNRVPCAFSSAVLMQGYSILSIKFV